MKKPKTLYEVLVGNIGMVYSGNDRKEANDTYDDYVARSKADYGRGGKESVVLMIDCEIEREHMADDPEQDAIGDTTAIGYMQADFCGRLLPAAKGARRLCGQCANEWATSKGPQPNGCGIAL